MCFGTAGSASITGGLHAPLYGAAEGGFSASPVEARRTCARRWKRPTVSSGTIPAPRRGKQERAKRRPAYKPLERT